MATPKQYREFNKYYNDFINTEDGKLWLKNITVQFDNIDLPEILKTLIKEADTYPPDEAINLFTEMKEEINIDKYAGKKINQNELDLYEMLINRYENRKKNLEKENKKFTMNRNFDLTAYPLTTASTQPYFCISKESDLFYIYDGQIGQNKFSYFKITSSCEAGEKCNSFYEKYVIKNEHRYCYSDDIQALKNFIEDKATIKLKGIEAYLKYYFEALPIEDKLINGFYTIQHFEALKDWFNLVLEQHNKKNEIHYSSNEIKEAEIRKFTTDILKKVEAYLLPPQTRNFAVISRATATEFIKFYEWLTDRKNELETPIETESNYVNDLNNSNASTINKDLVQTSTVNEIIKPELKAPATTKLLPEIETRTLYDLFKNPELYNDCLQLLRETDPRTISEENSFMTGASKGVVVVWFKAIEAQNLIDRIPNYNSVPIILNNTFKKLDVKVGIIKGKGKNVIAKRDYEAHFSNEIRQIKTKK